MLIKEAATTLRKSECWLRDWLKGHPKDANGRPFFAGRTKLFTPADIDRIHEAMRPASLARCMPAKFRAARSRENMPESA
jgi:hypothetical protein